MNLVLSSDRLKLTPLAEEDADLWVALRTDPDVMKYIGSVQDEDQLRTVMPRRCFRAGGGAIGFWKVSILVTGEGIGTGLLLPLPLENDDSNWDALGCDEFPEEEIEVGYNFLPSAWGNGYATEAACALIGFAFSQTPLEEIVAVTYPENLASQKVLRKAGMKGTGLRRAYRKDLPGFEIAKADWLASQAVS